MGEFIQEIREDFQIPPYFSDKAMERLIQEGISYFEMLNPGSNYETDYTYRSLLKNYVYYAYHHKTEEFSNNYASMILSWQLESEGI